MENFAEKLKALSSHELDEATQKLFYFKSDKESANNLKDTDWIQIPSTPLICYDIAVFGNFDVDHNDRYSKLIEDGSKINFYNIVYSKAFAFNTFYNIVNKHFNCYSNDGNIYLEMCESLVGEVFHLPPQLLGIVLYMKNQIDNHMDKESSNILNMNEEEQIDNVLTFGSIRYIKYTLFDIFVDFYINVKDNLNVYTEDNLITAFSYIATSAIYKYVLCCMKMNNVIIKTIEFESLAIKTISSFEVSNNIQEFYALNNINNINNVSYNSYFSILIDNIFKYFKKIRDMGDDINKDIYSQTFFDKQDIRFTNYCIINTNGNILGDTELQICKKYDSCFKTFKKKQRKFANTVDTNTATVSDNEDDILLKNSPLLCMVTYISLWGDNTLSLHDPALYNKLVNLETDPGTIDQDKVKNLVSSKEEMEDISTLKGVYENEIISTFLYFIGKNIC